MYFFHRYLQPALFVLVFFFIFGTAFSQSYYFGEAPVNWDQRKAYVIPPEAAAYANYDLVVLSELTEFHYLSATNERVVRNVKYKINTAKGLELLKHYAMPESFDFAFDAQLHALGRRAKIKIPHVQDFKINVFAARKFAREKWSNVSVKDRYETLRWIKSTGEFSDEENIVFSLGMMAVGDVVELYYDVEFNTRYGSNLFYFNGPYPKLKCEYDFIYRVTKMANNDAYLLPVNISPENVHTSRVNYDEYLLATTKISLSDLKANNYPLNSFEAGRLPHVYADFAYYRSLVRYNDKQYIFTHSSRPKSFEWVVTYDTTAKAAPVKTYDKQALALSKYAETFPPAGDEAQNIVFMKALCDTFNNYRYLNPNHLFYNESGIYDVYSVDHAFKRRLAGHSLWKLYNDLLKEHKVFYYLVNIEDKRFGEHDERFRVHHAYEQELFALPKGNDFEFFMTRENGLKYHHGELPFYFEEAKAALTPMNFQASTRDKKSKTFRMVKTRGSSEKENTRSEKAQVKVVLDSLLARVSIREELSGQYSTLLRHQYLNEVVDSTVNAAYYKRCTDKPGASAVKSKLVSANAAFPFPYAFDCSEKLKLHDSISLSLKNWFSFTLSKNMIADLPANDFYFDFTQSDSYLFDIEFNKAREVKNSGAFAKKIDNEYFFLESEIVKKSSAAYQVRVVLSIKQKLLPADKAGLLMELVEQLDQLNNFSLELAKN